MTSLLALYLPGSFSLAPGTIVGDGMNTAPSEAPRLSGGLPLLSGLRLSGPYQRPPLRASSPSAFSPPALCPTTEAPSADFGDPTLLAWDPSLTLEQWQFLSLRLRLREEGDYG